MYMNSRKKLSEMFIDKADTAYEDTIMSIMRTHLFRPPVAAEVDNFIKIMRNPNDTSRVVRAIKKTDEYKNLQLASAKSHSEILSPNIPLQTEYNITDKRVDDLPLPERTRYYRAIIAIYDRVLSRMPTMAELNYYTARMITDKTFDEKKLQMLIESSREFEILQKNQNNQVFSELSSGITDAQIEYEVEEIYKQAMGLDNSKKNDSDNDKQYRGLGDDPIAEYENRDQMMSTSLFDFLKHKYKEYELNEKRLFNLIVMIHDLDEKNIDVDMIINYSGASTDTNTKSNISVGAKTADVILDPIRAEITDPKNIMNRATNRFNDLSDQISERVKRKSEKMMKERNKRREKVLDTDPNMEEEHVGCIAHQNGVKRFVESARIKNKHIKEKYESSSALDSQCEKKRSRKKKDKRKKCRQLSTNEFQVRPLCGMDEAMGTLEGVRNTKYRMIDDKDKDKDKDSGYDLPYSYEEAKYPSHMHSYEPYNICNINPFTVIHNKTREVYDKKRNGFAYAQNNRNLEELKDRCHRQTRFLNAGDDMILFPEYKWTIPQPRPPVCEV